MSVQSGFATPERPCRHRNSLQPPQSYAEYTAQNRMTRIVLFYLAQTVLLGSVGFAIWVLYGWWRLGVFWTADTPEAWLFALLLVAALVLLICTPVQWIARKLKNRKYAYLFGLISGPVGVMTFLAVFTHYQMDFTNYILRQWLMHLIFGGLGLWFSINYHNRKPA